MKIFDKSISTLLLIMFWTSCSYGQESITSQLLVNRGTYFQQDCLVINNLETISSTTSKKSLNSLLLLNQIGNFQQCYGEDGKVILSKRLFDMNEERKCVDNSIVSRFKTADFVEVWNLYSDSSDIMITTQIYFAYLINPNGHIRIIAERADYYELKSINFSSSYLSDKLIYFTSFDYVDIDSSLKRQDYNLELQINFQGNLLKSIRKGTWYFFFPDGKIGKSIKYSKGTARYLECFNYSFLEPTRTLKRNQRISKVKYNGSHKIVIGDRNEILKKEKYDLDANRLPHCQCDLYR